MRPYNNMDVKKKYGRGKKGKQNELDDKITCSN